MGVLGLGEGGGGMSGKECTKDEEEGGVSLQRVTFWMKRELYSRGEDGKGDHRAADMRYGVTVHGTVKGWRL